MTTLSTNCAPPCATNNQPTKMVGAPCFPACGGSGSGSGSVSGNTITFTNSSGAQQTINLEQLAARTPDYPVASFNSGATPLTGPKTTAYPDNTPYADLKVSTAAGDVNMSTMTGAGLIDGAIVRVTKVSGDGNRLTWTDPQNGKVYNFADQDTEFMTFQWNKALGQFRII